MSTTLLRRQPTFWTAAQQAGLGRPAGRPAITDWTCGEARAGGRGRRGGERLGFVPCKWEIPTVCSSRACHTHPRCLQGGVWQRRWVRGTGCRQGQRVHLGIVGGGGGGQGVVLRLVKVGTAWRYHVTTGKRQVSGRKESCSLCAPRKVVGGRRGGSWAGTAGGFLSDSNCQAAAAA